MDSTDHQSSSLTTYLAVYVVILVISGLQILIAYENIDAYRIFIRMLLLAIIQAGLAVTFFMHMIWSDSFRLLNMRPFAH
jgi:cytochrome c oxidase subunit IV